MSTAGQDNTFIAAHSFFKGEMQFGGPTTIAGRIEGSIVAEDVLEVSAEGVVDGDIDGVVVDIHGTVTGNIFASRACRLGPTARVTGEMRAATLAISEGASFVGQVHVGNDAVAAADELEVVEAPAAQHTPINRIETLTEEVEEVAAAAVAATAAPSPTIRVNSQTIQQTIHRAPRIIRARGQ